MIWIILQLISLCVQAGCLVYQCNTDISPWDILGGYAIWGCVITALLGIPNY